MKLVLELKNKPRDGDILIFDKDGFKSVSKSVFLSELLKDIKELKIALNNADNSINKLNNEIKYLKGE